MAAVRASPWSKSNPNLDVERARYGVCDFCRIKKIKCDMVRPICGNCRLRCAMCTYSKVKRKPGPPKRHTLANLIAPEPANSCHPMRQCNNVSSSSTISQPWTVDIGDLNLDFTELTDHIESPSMRDWDSENYLLDLFFQHVQPTYPLFRRRAACAEVLPVRVKMATFSVACRFAAPDARKSLLLLSPATYAERARGLAYTQSSPLCIDDIKTSLLLCIYEMVEFGQWNSVAEVSKLVKMADMYQATAMDASSVSVDLGYEAEEWRSVWWTIYSLDTICSAVTASSHSAPAYVQDNIGLPIESIHDFTNPSTENSLRKENCRNLQMLPSNAKHWETLQTIFCEPGCRSRNLQLGVTSIMRSVTEVRIMARYNDDPALGARLHALESECAAVTFALPSWVFNPAQHYDLKESAEEHRSRLDALLIFFCARLLIKITTAKSHLRSDIATQVDAARSWRTILLEANQVTSVLQHWKPAYFQVADPMSAYIAYLAACVLVLDCKSASNKSASETSGHIDLLMLFLAHIGRFWSIGNRLKTSLCSLKRLSMDSKVENMLQHIFQIASFPQMDSKSPGSFEPSIVPTPANDVESDIARFLLSDYENTEGATSGNFEFDISNDNLSIEWSYDGSIGYNGATQNQDLFHYTAD